MKKYRLRKIVQSKDRTLYGITFPQTISACFTEGTLFTFQISGACVLLKSGCDTPTKKEVDNFDLESIKI